VRLMASILIMLSLTVTMAAAPARSEAALTPSAQEELNLRQDIQLLNLINGLYLTPQQMQKHQARMQQYTAAAKPVLQELRESLIAGRETPEDLALRVQLIEVYAIGRGAADSEDVLDLGATTCKVFNLSGPG